MFPNWTGWKTVKLVLFVLTGVVGVLPPKWSGIATVVLASLGVIVTGLSGTSAGPAMAKQVAQ